MTIAGKTGSTNSYNDRYFVGYTPYYTAAVWVGSVSYTHLDVYKRQTLTRAQIAKIIYQLNLIEK